MGLRKRRKRRKEDLPTDSEERQHKRYIESILADNEGGYLELVENSDNLIQSVTPGGVIYYVNRKWLETLKYDVDELEQMIFLDVIHPSSRSHCEEVFNRIMVNPGVEDVEFEFQAKDGTRVRVKGNVSSYFEGDEPIATRGFFRLISARPGREELSGIPIEEVFLAFHDKECSIAEPCLPD